MVSKWSRRMRNSKPARFFLLCCCILIGGQWLTNVRAQEPAPTDNVIVWSPDGLKIAVSGSFGIHIYTDQLKDASTQLDYANIPYHIAWSPDSEKLAVANADSSVQVWDVRTGSLVANLLGHTAGAASVTWSPDGSRVASAGVDGTIRIWDVSPQRMIRVLQFDERPVRAVGWSPDGSKLVSAGSESGLHIWDPNTGTLLANGDVSTVLNGSVSWSKDSIAFFLSSPVLYDGATAEVLSVRPCSAGSDTAAVWSYDGTTVVMLGHSQEGSDLCVETGDTGNVKMHLGLCGNAVVAVSISPTGDRIVAIRSDGRIEMWTADRGVLVASVPGRPTPTPPTPQKLRLIALCSPDPDHYRLWQVLNPNPYPVFISWKVDNLETEQATAQVIPAGTRQKPGERVFRTPATLGANVIHIYSFTRDLLDTQMSLDEPCAALTPTGAFPVKPVNTATPVGGT
jgi:WD40 repeat protein